MKNHVRTCERSHRSIGPVRFISSFSSFTACLSCYLAVKKYSRHGPRSPPWEPLERNLIAPRFPFSVPILPRVLEFRSPMADETAFRRSPRAFKPLRPCFHSPRRGADRNAAFTDRAAVKNGAANPLPRILGSSKSGVDSFRSNGISLDQMEAASNGLRRSPRFFSSRGRCSGSAASNGSPKDPFLARWVIDNGGLRRSSRTSETKSTRSNGVAGHGVCKAPAANGRMVGIDLLRLSPLSVGEDGKSSKPKDALKSKRLENGKSPEQNGSPPTKKLKVWSDNISAPPKLTRAFSASKNVNGICFFVGDPVSEEEARWRWPHHYVEKVSMLHCNKSSSKAHILTSHYGF